MSLRAMIEILVHAYSFKNIDLYRQGQYRIEFTLWHENAGLKYPAIPIAYAQAKRKAGDIPADEPEPASIDDTDGSFITKSFDIHYADEELILNDTATFRIEIEVETEKPTLTILARLFYRQNEKSEFEPFEERRAQVSNPLTACAEYVPFLFDKEQFCVLNTAIHFTLLDFPTRITPLLTPEQEKKANIHKHCSEKETDLMRALCSHLFQNRMDYSELVCKKFIQTITLALEKLRGLGLGYLSFAENEEDMSLSTQPSADDEVCEFNQKSDGLNESFYQEDELHEVAQELLTDLRIRATQLIEIWHKYQTLITTYPYDIIRDLKTTFISNVYDRWGESILREVDTSDDFNLIAGTPDLGKRHASMAANIRKSKFQNPVSSFQIQDLEFFPNSNVHPILFEDINILKNKKLELVDASDAPKGVNLYILVHGFQASYFDMVNLKNNISLFDTNATFLISTANEGQTDGDISEMGHRLSEEVHYFIQEYCPGSACGRINFVGHSLGGLIIRSALPYLENYSQKFDKLLTLSTPHLGSIVSGSKIISAGIWFLKKWRKSHCLTQIQMSDASNLKDTFIYKLSQRPGLNWFNSIMFVSSHQDSFVPFDSARVEVSQKASKDSRRGSIYIEMASNILSVLSTDKLYRIDVNFNLKERSLDKFIGRAAHLQFLDNQVLLKILAHRFLV